MGRDRRRYRKNYLPKQRKTIPIEGFGDDFGKFFKCWFCGFICKLGRDALDKSSGSRAGTGYEDYYAKSDPGLENRLVIDSSNDLVVLELDAAGGTKGILHQYKSVISGGCPLCGCKTWKE